MPETMSEARPVDAAASYCDPRAVPLRHAAKLLDLVYPELDDDQLRDQVIVPRLRNGRLRLLDYEHPRRRSDPPALVPLVLVRGAFQDLRFDIVYDPVHDRLHGRPRIIGAPPPGFRETPDGAERRREQQRLAALPPAIDWQGCRVRVGRYAYVNVKAILAEDLAKFPAAKGSLQTISPPRGKAPRDARERLQEMIKAVPNASALKAREVAEQILAVHAEVMHTDAERNLVNPDGWWTWGTLERYVSHCKD